MRPPEALPLTIAVVDDDDSIRRLVKHLLQMSGFAVIEARSGDEARQVLHEYPWDLAILDRKLPDIDGVELCAELKSDPEFRGRYIIMLTGAAQQQEKIEGLDLGADDYVTKPFQSPELLARVRAGKRVVDLQKELLAKNKQLELLSITDGLTQLYNHRYFQEEFTRKFEEAHRYGRPLSLALMDIDFFKKINDTYGHAAGDQVLRRVAELFMSSIRSVDFAARYGGEEFAVMMPETSLDDACKFAEKIRAVIADAPIPTDQGDIPVTLSIGISSIPYTRMKHSREMIELADKALYRAKRGGRNQVQAERRADLSRRKKATETPTAEAKA